MENDIDDWLVDCTPTEFIPESWDVSISPCGKRKVKTKDGLIDVWVEPDNSEYPGYMSYIEYFKRAYEKATGKPISESKIRKKFRVMQETASEYKTILVKKI